MAQSRQLVRLIEIAIMTAAAVILDIVSGMFLRMPQGGSVSIMMIPIFLISFRWGVKAGLTTGLLTGLVQIAIGNLFLQHPVQLLLDYIAAFAAVGISGFFASAVRKSALSKAKGKLIVSIICAVFIGSFLRYAAHVISGAVFFGSFAPKGTPVWLYSLTYNATYMIPSFIICAIALCLLFMTAPRLLKTEKA
ncbi:energy-coupled thiamine transporter ThiT [Bacillus halotolerans]|uniref:energy-coupled thiamine transporter ThiT n=1 Tax=Bacillus halotolerans TaxID=260554 RepID=UPI001662778B|nr:energy-coupled thiamine transporter ThiT [Bacillus halotolerans]MBV7321721.1 energy-coupled thiamine transporter ThiT [Halalkalibacterium halodurans]QNS19329.1 energy-coupled thiamine transporter ThiT [Bacillus halotolerans]UTL75769.1 energy-coupled thiamine transporter ThiT [Bacillus halotolerans]WJE42187.1 energy-coupled thiamine transporter ThiT [Bacillus halotolerans]WPC79692.1 energy-coupled thiamine transporter ThiT [Bacillus halotolerans]